MRITKDINVQPEKLSSGFSAALGLCRLLSRSSDPKDTIDFSRARFVTPAFVVPLAVYLESLDKTVEFINTGRYLQSVSFNTLGVNSGMMRRSEFIAFLEQYSNKRYIPLIRFPAEASRVEDKNDIISAVESIMTRQSGLQKNIVQGIKYMVGEVVDNISEHSKSSYGYIMAQCYPSSRYIDICIGDAGVTLLGSYSNVPNCEIFSDGEAMKAANSGISAKNLPEAENRGYGISTTKKMLVNGMDGQYMMVSGSAVYVNTKLGSGYFELPEEIRFRGTIVAMRVPYWNESFQYINYIE